jgi:hypothetical protein
VGIAVSLFVPPPPKGTQVLQPDGTFSWPWSGWLRGVWTVLNGNGAGVFSGTVTLAKLTAGGSNGSLTIVNGVITGYAAPS